jgi:hypothetical protein
MRRKFVTRTAAVLLAVGVVSPISAVVVSGGSAFAANGQISCAKLKGSETTQALTKCTGPLDIVGGTKTGKGTGTSTADSIPPTGYNEGSTVSWGVGGAGGTIDEGITYTTGTGCPGKDLTIDETAHVVSGTGNAAILVGDVTTGVVCVNTKKMTIANEKGTTANF